MAPLAENEEDIAMADSASNVDGAAALLAEAVEASGNLPTASAAIADGPVSEEETVLAVVAAVAEGRAARPVEDEPGHVATEIELAGLAVYLEAGGPSTTGARARFDAATAMHEAQGHGKGNCAYPHISTPELFHLGCDSRGRELRAPNLWDMRAMPRLTLAEGEAAAVDPHEFYAQHVESRHCDNCSATPRRPCYINPLVHELYNGHQIVFRRNKAKGPELIHPTPPLFMEEDDDARVTGDTIESLAAAAIVVQADARQRVHVNSMFVVRPYDFVPTPTEAGQIETGQGPKRMRAAYDIATAAADAVEAEMARAGVGDDARAASWDRGLNLRLQPRKPRLITNAKPLNRFVEKWHFRMDQLWRFLGSARQNGWVAKADVRRGFYHVRAAKETWKYFSFYHRGKVFQFHRIPMGATTSPAFFQWVTAEVNGWLRDAGIEAHLVYLDDFAVYAHTQEGCADALALLKQLCARVSIELAPDKTVGPTQEMILLGVLVNLVDFAVTIPGDRLVKLGIYVKLALRAARKGQKVPSHLLKSIAGRAGWISQMNPRMRAYTCNMDRLVHTGAGRSTMRHVPNGVVTALRYIDLEMRKGRLQGQTLAPGHEAYANRTVTITTDATLSATAAAIAMRLDTGVQVRVELPDCVERDGVDICVLELLALVSAVLRWGPLFRGHQIVCGCDNSGVVDWVDSGRSDRPDVLELLKELYRSMERYDLRVVAAWLPRWFNYRNDRVCGLPTAEVQAFAPGTVMETEAGSPIEALQRIRMMAN